MEPGDPPAPVRLRVMGTDAHLVVRGGPPGMAAELAALLDLLERRWSRFRPDSELSRLPADAPAVVSPETALLVHLAVAAWHESGGCFDPTVAAAMVAAGYDCDLADLPPVGEAVSTAASPRSPAPTPGCAGIAVDLATGMVQLPPDVRLDPGGIGKGLAADLAAARAIERGAEGVLVSVGGDLCVAGSPPPAGWEVAVDHPGAAEARVNLGEGGLATSAVDGRRWGTPCGPAHHLVDPATGHPAATGLRAVSVIAGTAWQAEAQATALLVGLDDGRIDGEALIGDGGALVTDAAGRRRRLGAAGDAFELAGRP